MASADVRSGSGMGFLSIAMVGRMDTGRSVLFYPFLTHIGNGGDVISDAILRMVLADSFTEAREGGQAPASKKSIEALRTVCGGESECCSICLEGLEETVVKEMPCKHRFHGGCIEKWLGIHGSCPFCRFQMPKEEEGVETKINGSDGNSFIGINNRR